ncbi:hypothetical protein V5799_007519 [Amblyomma americanum]|uniref:Transmembrane protein n=1 Tax=Amblyomma americanum TaxID=6943 RepID=A0AAQ4FH47_AMBAM
MESSSLIFSGNPSRRSRVVSVSCTLVLGLGTVAVTAFVLVTVFKGWQSTGPHKRHGALAPEFGKGTSPAEDVGLSGVTLVPTTTTSSIPDNEEFGSAHSMAPSSDQLDSTSSYSTLMSPPKDVSTNNEEALVSPQGSIDGSAMKLEAVTSGESVDVSAIAETGDRDVPTRTEHSSGVGMRQTDFTSDQNTGDPPSDLDGSAEDRRENDVSNEPHTQVASTEGIEESEGDSDADESTKLSAERGDQQEGLRDVIGSGMPSDAEGATERGKLQTNSASEPSTDYDSDEFDDEEEVSYEPTVNDEAGTSTAQAISTTQDDSEEEEEPQGYDSGKSAKATSLEDTASSSSTYADNYDDIESLIIAAVSPRDISHGTIEYGGGVRVLEESSASDQARSEEPDVATHKRDDNPEGAAQDDSAGGNANMKGFYATEGDRLPYTQDDREVESHQSDSVLEHSNKDMPVEFDGSVQGHDEPPEEDRRRDEVTHIITRNQDDTTENELQAFTTSGEVQVEGFQEATDDAASSAEDVNEAGRLQNTNRMHDSFEEEAGVSETNTGVRVPALPDVIRDAPSQTKRAGEVTSRPIDGMFQRNPLYVSTLSSGGVQDGGRMPSSEKAHSAVPPITSPKKDGGPGPEAATGMTRVSGGSTLADTDARWKKNQKYIKHNKRNMSLSEAPALEGGVHVASSAAARPPKVAQSETAATTPKPQRRTGRRNSRKPTQLVNDSPAYNKPKTDELSHALLGVTQNSATVRNVPPDVTHIKLTTVRSAYIDVTHKRQTATQNVHSNVTHNSTLRDTKAATLRAITFRNFMEPGPSDHGHFLAGSVALKSGKESRLTTQFEVPTRRRIVARRSGIQTTSPQRSSRSNAVDGYFKVPTTRNYDIRSDLDKLRTVGSPKP